MLLSTTRALPSTTVTRLPPSSDASLFFDPCSILSTDLHQSRILLARPRATPTFKPVAVPSRPQTQVTPPTVWIIQFIARSFSLALSTFSHRLRSCVPEVPSHNIADGIPEGRWSDTSSVVGYLALVALSQWSSKAPARSPLLHPLWALWQHLHPSRRCRLHTQLHLSSRLQPSCRPPPNSDAASSGS